MGSGLNTPFKKPKGWGKVIPYLLIAISLLSSLNSLLSLLSDLVVWNQIILDVIAVYINYIRKPVIVILSWIGISLTKSWADYLILGLTYLTSWNAQSLLHHGVTHFKLETEISLTQFPPSDREKSRLPGLAYLIYDSISAIFIVLFWPYHLISGFATYILYGRSEVQFNWDNVIEDRSTLQRFVAAQTFRRQIQLITLIAIFVGLALFVNWQIDNFGY